MTETNLSGIYRDYIACLNEQDWPRLGQFVHDGATMAGGLGFPVIARCWKRIFPKSRISISIFGC